MSGESFPERPKRAVKRAKNGRENSEEGAGSIWWIDTHTHVEASTGLLPSNGNSCINRWTRTISIGLLDRWTRTISIGSLKGPILSLSFCFDNGRFITQSSNTPGLYITKMHTAVQ
jgi:hypothetical protein